MDAFILSPRPASGKDSSISDFKITPTLQHSSSRPAQFLTPVSPSTPAAPAIPALSAAPGPKASPSEILDSLRNNPTRESVVLSLALLDAKLDIRSPSPASSQITKVLLDSTVPDFWHVLSKSERRLLSRCLASPTGLGGIAAKLKTLIPPARDSPRPAAAAFRENLGNLLALLQLVLGRPGFVYGVWALAGKEQEIKRDLLWKEFAALVGGGRLLSLAAEADVALGRLSDGAKERWVGDGKLYALWLGREIAEACLLFALEDAASWKAVTLLLSAGFRLGYPGGHCPQIHQHRH